MAINIKIPTSAMPTPVSCHVTKEKNMTRISIIAGHVILFLNANLDSLVNVKLLFILVLIMASICEENDKS